ncbi:fimbrial protein [Pseudomonas fluorescens]|nr:fimbrial protein [Pseudomonas fluorescens]
MRISKEISITHASCQASAALVQMGNDYQLEEFSKVGSTARTVKFNIHLSGCQSGINNVTYALLATSTSPPIDYQKGTVALRNDQRSAKGIGLQLMNGAGEPISLYKRYPFNGFIPNSTSFNIPLSAAYYRLADDKPKAGTADASVTFEMEYL